MGIPLVALAVEGTAAFGHDRAATHYWRVAVCTGAGRKLEGNKSRSVLLVRCADHIPGLATWLVLRRPARAGYGRRPLPTRGAARCRHLADSSRSVRASSPGREN